MHLVLVGIYMPQLYALLGRGQMAPFRPGTFRLPLGLADDLDQSSDRDPIALALANDQLVERLGDLGAGAALKQVQAYEFVLAITIMVVQFGLDKSWDLRGAVVAVDLVFAGLRYLS